MDKPHQKRLTDLTFRIEDKFTDFLNETKEMAEEIIPA
jgi:hypothetical protein